MPEKEREKKKININKLYIAFSTSLTPLTSSLTSEIEVTLINRLCFGEQDSSQNRFRKFLKHAGQPTRNGIACNRLYTINFRYKQKAILELTSKTDIQKKVIRYLLLS